MPTLRQRILDLLAIGRVSNLPTVWSNVLLGMFLACAIPIHVLGSTHQYWAGRLGFPEIFLTLIGVSCAYLCGTFLNDWKDAEFDRQHRPERAIPSQRLSRSSILALAISFGVVATVLFGIVSIPALATVLLLIGCILIYTWMHKRTPLAVIPMGLCRTLVYVLGFLVVTSGMSFWEYLPGHLRDPSRLMGDPVPAHVVFQLATMAIGILIYIAGLTLAARYESRPEGMKAPRALIWFLIFVPVLTHTWWWLFRRPPFLEGAHLAIPALLGILPFLVWTTRALFVLKNSIPDFVSRSLAGICLVDLLAFPGLAATIVTPWPALNDYPLLLALIPLSLFLLALLLQRIAPAT